VSTWQKLVPVTGLWEYGYLILLQRALKPYSAKTDQDLRPTGQPALGVAPGQRLPRNGVTERSTPSLFLSTETASQSITTGAIGLRLTESDFNTRVGAGGCDMRKPVALGIVAISCMTAFLATNRIALGQAGSTGGTIGKTDKSASGGEDLDENRGRPHRANKQSGPAGGSLTGRWDWEAICYGIRYFGDFRIREVGGQLTGEFLDDSGGQ
jgi:hypothetical protein